LKDVYQRLDQPIITITPELIQVSGLLPGRKFGFPRICAKTRTVIDPPCPYRAVRIERRMAALALMAHWSSRVGDCLEKGLEKGVEGQ